MYFCRNFLLISAVILSQNVFSSDASEIDWKAHAESYQQHLEIVSEELEKTKLDILDKESKIDSLLNNFVNSMSRIIPRLKVLRSNVSAKGIMTNNMQILNSIVTFATVIYSEKDGRKTNVYIPIYSRLTDIVTKGENAIPNPATADWENDTTWDEQ